MISKLVLFIVISITSVLAQDVSVTIPNGSIKGSQINTQRGATFYAFQQIPFAKPPVGDLRFADPQPADKWSGVLDGTASNKICFQMQATVGAQETEDCLYLNVYTPVNPSTSPAATLPVMFYIHGGAFLNGNSNFGANGPHYFMEHDVIVVTALYRVGALGFLSTGDSVMPGNYGLKDQVLALKWVQENIQYFGGDKTKVTIFGLSAGGASVGYHLLSPLSAGLFRGAIQESGSALCPWAYQRSHKDFAFKLASLIGATPSSSEELLNYLRLVPATNINTASQGNFGDGGIGHDMFIQGFRFAPVIEPASSTAFISDYQYGIIENGVPNKVPLMIGIASEEQIARAADISSFQNLVQQYEGNISMLVNDNMHITNLADLTAAGEAIRKIYTDGTLQSNLAGAVKYFSDMSFSVPIIHQAKLESSYTDVYFYKFSYHGTLGNNNVYVEGAERVTHSEDNNYLWAYGGWDGLNSNPAADVTTSERYVTLYTNFAKYLNPTPEASELLQNVVWPKVSPTALNYLNIDTNLEVSVNPKGDIYQKWVDLYEQKAIKPYDTF